MLWIKIKSLHAIWFISHMVVKDYGIPWQYLYDELVRTPDINGPFIWLNLEMDHLADDSNIKHNSVVDMRRETFQNGLESLFKHYLFHGYKMISMVRNMNHATLQLHDDVIKWKHFPCYWPFVRGIHRSPVNSPHRGQWRRALMFSLICAWTNGWVNNRYAGHMRRHRAHHDVTVMYMNHATLQL